MRRGKVRNYRETTKIETTMEKVFSVVLLLLRLFLAALFIFSGFVKVIDPLGSTYKFEDYLYAFGDPYARLAFLAFPAAIALSTFELLLGICFLFKIKLKSTSIAALLLMFVMLPLTLYIAIYDPVTDCGCFGDALVISNWATFYKNIFITAAIIIVLAYNKKIRRFLLPAAEWIAILIFVVFGVGLSIYSYKNLPMIDFRPYKVGINLPEAMKIPEGMPTDKYETTLVYEKDGKRREFTLDNYPKNDTTWVFSEQHSVLVERGYIPPVHDFSIVDRQYNDLTDELLSHPGPVYLLIMYDLEKTDVRGAVKAEELYEEVKRSNKPFYALTASDYHAVDEFKEKHNLTYPFCTTDPITLKTIVRANPGLMVLQNGTVISKQNMRAFKRIQ